MSRTGHERLIEFIYLITRYVWINLLNVIPVISLLIIHIVNHVCRSCSSGYSGQPRTKSQSSEATIILLIYRPCPSLLYGIHELNCCHRWNSSNRYSSNRYLYFTENACSLMAYYRVKCSPWTRHLFPCHYIAMSDWVLYKLTLNLSKKW